MSDGALSALVRTLPVAAVDGPPLILGEGVRLVLASRAPAVMAAGQTSRSRAGGFHAAATGTAGRVGVDLETLERVAVNATEEDRWLAPVERALVRAAPCAVLELACHWVLKEAYGKALGVGLAMPLAALAFVGMDDAIVLRSTAARDDRWRFLLGRCEALVIGVAWRADRQAATPFAPFGRKPPTVLLDR